MEITSFSVKSSPCSGKVVKGNCQCGGWKRFLWMDSTPSWESILRGAALYRACVLSVCSSPRYPLSSLISSRLYSDLLQSYLSAFSALFSPQNYCWLTYCHVYCFLTHDMFYNLTHLKLGVSNNHWHLWLWKINMSISIFILLFSPVEYKLHVAKSSVYVVHSVSLAPITACHKILVGTQ